MKLSNETIATLKNFSAINSNVILNSGNVVKTMSESKTILGSATVAEDFPGQIGIYDLNEFLSVLGMFDSPDLFFEETLKSVKITEGKRAVKYFFSEPSILTSPSKDINMPPCEVTFTLTNDDMSSIRKAASALGVTDMVVRSSGTGDTAVIVVTDTKDATSNTFELEVEGLGAHTEKFNFIFNISNFKFVAGDYDVSISSKLISNFKLKGSETQYWVALEKNSTYGE